MRTSFHMAPAINTETWAFCFTTPSDDDDLRDHAFFTPLHTSWYIKTIRAAGENGSGYKVIDLYLTSKCEHKFGRNAAGIWIEYQPLHPEPKRVLVFKSHNDEHDEQLYNALLLMEI